MANRPHNCTCQGEHTCQFIIFRRLEEFQIPDLEDFGSLHSKFVVENASSELWESCMKLLSMVKVDKKPTPDPEERVDRPVFLYRLYLRDNTKKLDLEDRQSLEGYIDGTGPEGNRIWGVDMHKGNVVLKIKDSREEIKHDLISEVKPIDRNTSAKDLVKQLRQNEIARAVQARMRKEHRKY